MGFYAIVPGDVEGSTYFAADIVSPGGSGKAFNYFRRPDGVIVGLWKNQFSALSSDNGETWTKISKNRTLKTDGAKTWGQRMDDGRYIVVHNQSATSRNRYPMTSITGSDGYRFDDLLSLRNGHSIPALSGYSQALRYPLFPRHIRRQRQPARTTTRGLSIRSTRRDVWIARLPANLTGSVDEPVDQDFEDVQSISELDNGASTSRPGRPSTSWRILRMTTIGACKCVTRNRLTTRASNV